MITWSLWVVLVWWAKLSADLLSAYFSCKDINVSNTLVNIVVVPAPFILLDYLI